MQAEGVKSVPQATPTRAPARCLIRIGVSLLLVWPLIVAFPRGSVEGQAEQSIGQPPTLDALALSATTRLGITYAGLLAIDPPAARDNDYVWLDQNGYKLVRVWVTWSGPLGAGPCNSGSLVTADGQLRGGPTGTLAQNFRELLKEANTRDWVIDITFDVEEFTRIGGTTFTQYKNAIATVVNYVRAAQVEDGADYIQRHVIVDVANEVIGAQQAESTSDPKFLNLYELSGTVGTNYWNLLRTLLNTARGGDPKIRAFFSMVGVGSTGSEADDKAQVERAASRYNKVYGIYGAESVRRPLLAPHLVRGPCPHGWADRTSSRVSYMRNWNGEALNPFETYLQEENKRGGGCCTNRDPCPSLDTLAEAEPLVTGCRGGWPPGCYKSCDSLMADWKTSLQDAKASKVYSWVFHTTAGMGRENPDKQMYKYMDSEEVKIATGAKGW